MYLLQRTVFAASKAITYGPIGYDITNKSLYSTLALESPRETAPADMVFNNDGTKMFVIGTSHDGVYEYSLLTAYNTKTASFERFYSTSGQEATATDMAFNGDGTSMYVVGSTSDSVHQYDLSSAYDISTASFSQSFSVSTQETLAAGMTFNDDGSKMYVIGTTGDDVNEYNLSSAYDISTAVYSKVFSVASQDGTPQDVSFNGDGTRMYITGNTNDKVHEYTLSTGFDVATAVHANKLVSSQDGTPSGIAFNDDGTKIYMVGNGSDRVNEYDLGAAYDVTTATFLQSFLVSGQDGIPQDVTFNTDGTKMYMLGSNSDRVNEYDLSTGFDISTAVYSQNLVVTTEDTNATGMSFNADGTKMFIVGSTNDRVYEYTLGTGFDVSTASYTQFKSIATEELNATDVTFNSDGTEMYIIGTTGDTVDQYNLSTGFDVSTATYTQNFSVTSQDATPQDVLFKPDGTKMYMVGLSNDRIYQYKLSTGFDVSTATLPAFSFASQENSPTGFTFNNTGSKMYTIGTTGDDINEYDLSSNFDVTTASYLQNFSVAIHNTNSHGTTLSSDGTKMFVIDNAYDKVMQYNLATAYDVGTGTLAQSYSIASKELLASGVTFNTEGTRMYITGIDSDSVHQYNLSSAYNIYTASFSQSFSVAAQETSPSDVAISNDGTKMFVIGQGSDNVNQYTLPSPYNISTAVFAQSTSIAAQEINSTGLAFNENGSKMFVVGTASDSVYYFDLSTSYDISTAAYNDSSSVAAESLSPQSVTFANQGKELYVFAGDFEEVLQYSTVDIVANGFNEFTANDGSVDGKLAFRLTGDTFQDTDNDNVLDVGSEVTLGNIPAGLTPTITLSEGDSVGTLTLGDYATNHEDEDDVANITFSFSNSAFVGGNAASVTGATGPASSGSGIDFSDTTFIDTSRISVDSNGAEAGAASYEPSISNNGRYTAYYSDATDLIASDTNGTADVFLYDSVTETTARVSVGAGGVQANGASYLPSISGDGRFVAYMSDATNLVAGDTNGVTDIFLYDTVTETTTRVSVDSGGNEADIGSGYVSVSDNGRYITYHSDATNLVVGDTNGATDVFLYDTVAETTTRVSVDSGGNEGDAYSYYPAISGDGQYVTYTSDSTNLVASDTNGASDVFLYNVDTQTTTRASVVTGGAQSNGNSISPSISVDGRYITYYSDASNLGSDTNGTYDIFLFDTNTTITTMVSVDSNGVHSDNASYEPVISDDGKYIAYQSDGATLVNNDYNGLSDIYVYEVDTARTMRISLDPDRNEVYDGTSSGATISGDGKYIAYQSSSSSLVFDDTNAALDVFLTQLVSANRLNYAAGSHGSVSGNTAQTVLYGLDGTAVTAVPDSGYHFVKWSDNSTQNPRTDTDVVANISVTASFAANDSGPSSGGSSSSSGSSTTGPSSSEDTTDSPTPDTDSIPNEIEDAAPNDGDANDDGIKDSLQNNVASFYNSVTGSYAILEVPASCMIQSVLVGAESRNEVQDPGAAYPLGLMDFTVKCEFAGQTVPIAQYYYAKTDTDELVMRKYNAAQQTYKGLPVATIDQISIKDNPVVKARYSIVEGGQLDEDGLMNKVIVDPSGPAREKTNETIAIKKEKQASSTNYLIYILSAAGIAIFIYLYRRNKKTKKKTGQ